MTFIITIAALFLWFTICSSLECLEAYSCMNSYESDTWIRMGGYKSGFGTSLEATPTGTIQCDGSDSCQHSPLITTHAGSFYCNGDKSCVNSNIIINETNNVEQDISLLATSVACLGTNSCQNSTINGTKTACHGDHSCSNTILNCHSVNGTQCVFVGWGAFALTNSVVYSRNNDINIRLNGYLTGYNLFVLCRSGQTCQIICDGNACNHTFIICVPRILNSSYSGCNIDRVCDEDRSIQCPEILQFNNETLYEIIETINYNDNIMHSLHDNIININEISNYFNQYSCNESSEYTFDSFVIYLFCLFTFSSVGCL